MTFFHGCHGFSLAPRPTNVPPFDRPPVGGGYFREKRRAVVGQAWVQQKVAEGVPSSRGPRARAGPVSGFVNGRGKRHHTHVTPPHAPPHVASQPRRTIALHVS